MKKKVLSLALGTAIAATFVLASPKAHASEFTNFYSGNGVNITALGSTGVDAPVYSNQNHTVSFNYVLRYKLTDAINVPKTQTVLTIDDELKPYVTGAKIYGNTIGSKKGLNLTKDYNGNFIIKTKEIFQTGFIGYNQYARFELSLSQSVANLPQDDYLVKTSIVNQNNAYVKNSAQQVVIEKNDLNVTKATGTYSTAAKLGFVENTPQASDRNINLAYEIQYQLTLNTFAKSSYYKFTLSENLLDHVESVDFTSTSGKSFKNIQVPTNGVVTMPATSLYYPNLAISVPYKFQVKLNLKNGKSVGMLPAENYVIYGQQNYGDSTKKANSVVDHTFVQVGFRGLSING